MTDIFKDATSNSLFFELVDSTTGLPKTGILYTDVTGSYSRTRSARVAITMATLASASAAYSSGGFILEDDTNQPGVYRFDVPNAAFATGVFEVVITVKATGCRTVSRLINLVDINNQIAYAPNVASGGVGGLLTAPTTANVGTSDVLRWRGTVVSDPTVEGVPDVNVKTWNDLATVALPLTPTTAGRTLDVSTGGEAGVDWANVGSPTTSLALTGTTIATTQKVDVETIKTNPVVNAGTITFPTGATLASTTNITAGTITTVTTVTNQLTAAQIATGVWTDTTAGDFTVALSVGKSLMNGVTLGTGLTIASVTTVAAGGITSSSFAAGAIDAAAMNVTGSEFTAIPWNASWDAEVQSEVQDAIEVNHLDHLLAVDYDPASKPGIATALLNEIIGSDAGVSQFTANALELAPTGGSAPTVGQIADAVWEELVADHSGVSGSTAEALSAAGGAGDPWVTTLPGSYTGSQAGKMLSDILTDTAEIGAAGAGLTVLATQASVNTIDDFLDTEIAAIKAKTDNLPSDPADASDIASSFTTVNTKLDTIDDFLDLEIAAIKTKTDNLPSDPADQSLLEAAITSATSTLATQASVNTIDDFLDTEIAAIKAKTDNLPADPADASDIAASFTTVNTKLDTIDDFVDTEVAAIKAKTDLLVTFPTNFSSLGINASGHISRVTLVDTTTTNTDLVSAASIATAVFTTAMVESYAADGVAPTLAQATFLMMQAFTEFIVSGSTLTVKKLDGSTTAATYTLDASYPSASRTRAT